MFPNPHVIPPMARNLSFHYQIPKMDPAYMNNPYYIQYNNYPFAPMPMYHYPMPNPNMNNANPFQSSNNQSGSNEGTGTNKTSDA